MECSLCVLVPKNCLDTDDHVGTMSISSFFYPHSTKSCTWLPSKVKYTNQFQTQTIFKDDFPSQPDDLHQSAVDIEINIWAFIEICFIYEINGSCKHLNIVRSQLEIAALIDWRIQFTTAPLRTTSFTAGCLPWGNTTHAKMLLKQKIAS